MLGMSMTNMVLGAFGIFMVGLWIIDGAKAMARENKDCLRLCERDRQINKLISWQAEAISTLDTMKERLEEGIKLYDKLEEADVRSRDLAKLNADLVAIKVVFKSRFPLAYEIVMGEIENGELRIEKGQSLIENGELRIENESGVLRTLDKGTTASACNGGVSATA